MKNFMVMMLLFLVTLPAFAVKERKVSNSHYYRCDIERENVLNNELRRDYTFPYPMEAGSKEEITGSARWAKYKIVFDSLGKVDITISEDIGGEVVSASKVHQIGKIPHSKSFKVTVELKKGDISVPYHLQCFPE